ncbi:MAG: tetratricopeptide repeat protein [Pseudomonadaceae bacterium]|nr:tetratricopeptide repeat protein [Pseudomonadaceae bacterium]
MTHPGYSTREVAGLIGLPPARIRHYARRALVLPVRGPRNEYRFGFRDVVVLRTAKRLLDASVSSHRTLQTLLDLSSRDVPGALSSTQILADGRRILVREADRLWEVDSGQGAFDFVAEQPGSEQRPKSPAPVAQLNSDNWFLARERAAATSSEWYNLGLDLEEVDLDRAINAYRQAIQLNEANADARVNLGRLLQLDGLPAEAAQHYSAALEIAPDHQLALYNLGTVFDERDEHEQAALYYRRAVDVPDAHYNLARLSELAGDELSARRHLRCYRQLSEDRQVPGD